MNIQEKLSQVTSFQDLHVLLEKADVTISFLGTHRVVANGYQGAASLDNIVLKAHNFKRSKELTTKEEFENEYEHGTAVISLIDKIHVLDKQKVSECNYITQLICLIRAFFPCCNSENLWADDGIYDYSLESHVKKLLEGPHYTVPWQNPDWHLRKWNVDAQISYQ